MASRSSLKRQRDKRVPRRRAFDWFRSRDRIDEARSSTRRAGFSLFDSPGKQLEVLLTFFRENNYQVVYKEILPGKIKRKLNGLTVSMVRVPQFQPLHLRESLPAFGGKRLREVPEKIGFRARKQLNIEPHPFP